MICAKTGWRLQVYAKDMTSILRTADVHLAALEGLRRTEK